MRLETELDVNKQQSKVRWDLRYAQAESLYQTRALPLALVNKTMWLLETWKILQSL